MKIYKIASSNKPSSSEWECMSKEAGMMDGAFKKTIQWIQNKYPAELQQAQQIAQQSGGDAQKLAELLNIEDPNAQSALSSALQEAQGITTSSSESKMNRVAGTGMMGFIQRHWKAIGIVGVLAILVIMFGPSIAEVLQGGGAEAIGQMGDHLDVDKLNQIGDAFSSWNSQIGQFTAFEDQAGNIFAQDLDANVYVQGKDEFGTPEWQSAHMQFGTVRPSAELQNFDMSDINDMKEQVRQDMSGTGGSSSERPIERRVTRSDF